MRIVTIGLAGVVALTFALGAAARTDAAEAGFVPIFDGKTLDGWDGNPKLWRVENGAIVGETTKENPAPGNTFLIWRKDKPADFQLKAEFRMPNPGFANSGIQIRSWEGPQKWRVSGYQPDMDWENHYTGFIYGENYRGILAQRGQKVLINKDHQSKVLEQFGNSDELAKFIKPHGWNEYDITAQGNHISQKVNGHLMCELTDEDTQARRDGIIALQLHAGPPMRVEFRNMRLKMLAKPAGGAKARPAAQMNVVEAKKKIVFIAGRPSHGYGEHEHNAGCTLLAKCLNENVPGVEAVVYKNGWPQDPHALDGAATVVIYADGGDANPAIPHLEELDKLLKRGVGLACIHYAVEMPKGAPGDAWLRWIGGYFETFWSVNPNWKAEFKTLPHHPVTNGVKPFAIEDEWYYHMRFVGGDDSKAKGLTPILTAVPPDSTRRDGNDAHGANAYVRARKGMAEHVAWAFERPGGGRGFGFTGGHWHFNWGNPNFRTIVLNGIVWTAGLDVPAGGVPSKSPRFAELDAHLDKVKPGQFDDKHYQGLLEQWNKEAAK